MLSLSSHSKFSPSKFSPSRDGAQVLHRGLVHVGANGTVLQGPLLLPLCGPGSRKCSPALCWQKMALWSQPAFTMLGRDTRKLRPLAVNIVACLAGYQKASPSGRQHRCMFGGIPRKPRPLAVNIVACSAPLRSVQLSSVQPNVRPACGYVCGSIHHGAAQYGMAWHGMVWYGMVEVVVSTSN